MMEFKNFQQLYGYVISNTLQELLRPIYQHYLDRNIDGYSPNVNDETMCSILKEKYNSPFIEREIADVTDIKENINRYSSFYENVFSDDVSKNVLFLILAYRLTLDKTYMYLAWEGNSRQYFDFTLVRYRKDCVFVDCGGLDGKTTAEFALECPDYKHIYLYEPIPEFYSQCRKNIDSIGLKNVTVRKAAVFDSERTLHFDYITEGSSKVSEQGTIEITAVTLDSDIKEEIGFIKMDIEGSEVPAIKGAREHILTDSPVLAISVYHKPGDIWNILELINSINPDYTFYLRHYQINTDETVLYAVPKNENIVYSTPPMAACRQYVASAAWYDPNKKAVDEMVYLYRHLREHQAALRNCEKVVDELKVWNQELEEGRGWLTKQNENKDTAIAELKVWNQQLVEGRDWLTKQNDEKEAIILELKTWAQQLEEAKNYHAARAEYFENELKKLNDMNTTEE